MPDFTDSFCERCGTRYAFVGDAPKGPSLKGARVLAKGLRNFVLTDGQSLSDSLEAARYEDSHESSTRITEAFRRTFNFCMECRQYACERCWNAGAGACLSCVPLAESEPPSMPAPTPSIFAAGPLAQAAPPVVHTTPEQPPAAAEWSLFTDASKPERAPLWAAREAPETPGVPASPDLASPGPAFSEWGAEPKLEPAAPLAWPAVDLQEAAAAAAAGSNGKNGDGPARRQVDPEAANLWPIADQIAPEMALTAEELSIIQAQLSQAAPVAREPLVIQREAAPQAEAAPSAEAAPQAEAAPPLLEHTPTWWNRRPADDDADGSAAWNLDNAWARDDEIVSGPSPEPAPAELVLADGPESIGADEAWAAEPIAEDEAPALSPHLLRRTLTATVLPTLASMTPRPTVPEPSGLVARLFGQRTSDEAVGAAPRGASRKSGPVADPWPHATRWSERPAEGRHWRPETETPRAETWTSETPIQDVTPEYIEAPAPAAAPAGTFPAAAEARAAVPSEPTPTSRSQPIAPTAPVAPAAAHVDLDSRSAAALRLSAVESAASYLAPDPGPAETFTPAAQVTLDPEAAPAQPADTLFHLPAVKPERRRAPQREPAWIRARREATESASAPEPETAEFVPAEAAPAAPAPAAPAMPVAQPAAAAPQAVPAPPQRPAPEAPAAPPATAWPPLGASWPSREDPTAPWPAPDAPAVPAIVAAAQVPTPTIAEMWAQSSQEVVNRGSVRVCGSCALPVSTKARFCRRCGSPQG
jgi:hypothetical protein